MRLLHRESLFRIKDRCFNLSLLNAFPHLELPPSAVRLMGQPSDDGNPPVVDPGEAAIFFLVCEEIRIKTKDICQASKEQCPDSSLSASVKRTTGLIWDKVQDTPPRSLSLISELVYEYKANIRILGGTFTAVSTDDSKFHLKM
ncbi:hypothetical protein CVT26_006863, partial [Gymnopilus dilepis]